MAMVLTGREIGGAICLAGSTLTFAFLHWLSSDDQLAIVEQAPAEDDEPDFNKMAEESEEFARRLKEEDDKRWGYQPD
ncbi:hypothetical protein NXT3_CH01852 [Sinorhizobium fredii]|uniref:Uncharacterized protein n=1 Tax=Rhizobium fredii TaxID=380 RepID=A0A2L0H4L8_RHIFR|nr:hypothetical protein NXT3_CH01852 [Sinorhizobium fredii]